MWKEKIKALQYKLNIFGRYNGRFSSSQFHFRFLKACHLNFSTTNCHPRTPRVFVRLLFIFLLNSKQFEEEPEFDLLLQKFTFNKGMGEGGASITCSL